MLPNCYVREMSDSNKSEVLRNASCWGKPFALIGCCFQSAFLADIKVKIAFLSLFNCWASRNPASLANLEVCFRIVNVNVSASVTVSVPGVKMAVRYLSYESSFDISIFNFISSTSGHFTRWNFSYLKDSRERWIIETSASIIVISIISPH